MSKEYVDPTNSADISNISTIKHMPTVKLHSPNPLTPKELLIKNDLISGEQSFKITLFQTSYLMAYIHDGSPRNKTLTRLQHLPLVNCTFHRTPDNRPSGPRRIDRHRSVLARWSNV